MANTNKNLVNEEILKNHKGDDENFEVKNLASILCKRVVGVRLFTGRGKMTIQASDRVLGISKKEGVAEDFRKKNIKAGAFLYFDDKIIKGFDNLFANIRQSMLRYSISKEGNIYYMAFENYSKFKEYFENTYMVDFNEKKKELIENIDTHKATFKNSLESWLTEAVDDEADRKYLLNYYVSKFPTKEQMEADCNMQLLLSAYPVVVEDNLNGINLEIANAIKESSDQSTMDTLYNMINKNLVEAYKITEKLISTIDVVTTYDGERLLNLKMGSRTKGLLNQTIDYIRNNNYLLKNDTVDTIIFLLTRIFIEKKDVNGKVLTNNGAVEISERLLAGIYGYAKHIGKEDEFVEQIKGSEYEVEVLEILSEEVNLEEL